MAAFPEYSYVPGQWPHPHQSPSYQAAPEAVPCPAPEDWQSCRPYLWGIDLWNYGYYWEAHEAWESLWHAAGRKGPLADFFKGLIQLAVAGVKVRERKQEGVRFHAERGAELFDSARRALGQEAFFGLELTELIEMAREFANTAPEQSIAPEKVRVVFARFLRLAGMARAGSP